MMQVIAMKHCNELDGIITSYSATRMLGYIIAGITSNIDHCRMLMFMLSKYAEMCKKYEDLMKSADCLDDQNPLTSLAF